MTRPGWIVTVEDPAGDLRYAVAVGDPFEAEEIVRSNLGLADDMDVSVWKPADAITISGFKLAAGEMKGPF